MAKNKLTLEDVLVPKEEIPYEVPENWCWVKLGSIVNLKSGINIKEDKLNNEGQYLYVKVSDMNLDINSVNIEGSINRIDDISVYSKNMIPSNSIIFPKRGGAIATNKKRKVNFPIVVDTNTMAIIVPQNINFNYIYLWFLSIDLWTLNSGSSIPQINNKDIEPLMVPLPPLAEQERIVKRIESLFDKVDKAKELVEEARDGFEKRRAAILEKALSGELTKKWREENSITIDKIISKIENLNKEEKKNFEFTESTEIFEIPENWKWMKLKDLCSKFKYGTSAKSQPEGDIPVLRMGNLQGGVINWNKLVYTSDEAEIEKYDLRKGDLLFNRTNSPELVGKTSIYMGEREAIYAGYLIRIRTYENVNSKYINYFMNSTFAKARCYEVKTDGVSQSNINAEKLGDFDIPLPSIEEQNEIARILDRLFEEERDIEEVSDVSGTIDIIKKSILAKAFRGELEKYEVDQESSLIILDKIIK